MSTLSTTNLKHPSSASNNLVLTSGGATQIAGLTYPTADGSNGQYLRTNGSGALSFATVNSPDVPLDWPGGAVEAGAGGITQITFGSIDANAKRITLKWYHCGLAGAGVAGQLRLRAGSGGSIMTTNNYQYSVSVGAAVDNTANADHIRLVHPSYTDAQHRHYGQATIENINFTDRWTVIGNSASIDHGAGGCHVLAGGFDLPGTLDRIQFFCPSSSFADGRINILVEG